MPWSRSPAAVARFVLTMKARWVAKGLPDYPLWIAGLIDSAALGTAIVAATQRWHDGFVLTLGLFALALAPWVIELWGRTATWPAFVLLTGGAVATVMVRYPIQYDFAPFLLVIASGHVTAVNGFWRGLAVMTAGEAVVVAMGVHGVLAGAEVAIWAVGIGVGLDIGYVMRSQQLRIQAQAREHAVRENQAVLEERQRIAREVHDLVAHSLSVTMLHLTAARREVEDAAAVDPGLGDALEALTEAERVGRRAMADIRSTVGLLGQGSSDGAPTVGLVDLPDLVADFRRAGLQVAYDARGDLGTVPASTALGLYRIVQESLANVAKHAPGSRVVVRLDVDRDPGELVFTSDLPRGTLRRNAGGSGLTGMAQRAVGLGATFRAGPEGRSWVVRVGLPRGDADGAHACPLPRRAGPFRRTVQGVT